MENRVKSQGLEIILFGFTRVFAIGGSLIGLIALVFVVFNLLGSGESTYVSLEDINTESSKQNNSLSEASSKSQKPLNSPENVIKYLSGDNEKILQGWLEGISKQEQKQEFLDNMSDVITDAEKKKVDIITVINNYKIVKLSKLTKSEIEQYKEIGQKAALYSVIFGLIIFIALMNIVLVMLAVERNTRHR
jgi:hypothetical protein